LPLLKFQPSYMMIMMMMMMTYFCSLIQHVQNIENGYNSVLIISLLLLFFHHGATAPSGARASSLSRIHNHTQTQHTG